ncbi:MAG TPA: protein kinase [Pyrinomonadaceae bacterium]|nr:protein kinase [Pyrinomonadaceae bacterium]
MDCPNCHQPMREGVQFCTRCGTRTISGRDSLNDSVPTVEHAETVGSGAQTITGEDPLVGRVLDGKYEIVAQLGAGGMGAVYRARRVLIGDEVAVKVLHAKFVNDDTLVERFRREARAAAQLQHPNVVTIHDYGEARGREGFAYIVMELVRGESLRDLLRREVKLDARRAVALMRDVCAGVGAAHRRGIVHRDLKPDNVIVIPADEDSPTERVKVVDFGIAKLRDMAADNTLTAAGAMVGTPFYMSPEQCKGESLDARADVYSLGAMLYELLAGAPPFNAPTLTGIIIQHISHPPPPIPQDAGVPPSLQAAIERALSKDSDKRQSDAGELSREIQSALNEAGSAGATNATNAGGGAATVVNEASRPTDPIFPASARPAHVTPTPTTPTPQTPTSNLASHASTNVEAQRAAQTHPQPHAQQTYTQPPPQQHQHAQPLPPRKKSRAPLAIGLIVLLLAGLGGLVVVGLILLGSNGGRGGVAVNINARPTPRPAPTRGLPTPPPANANAVVSTTPGFTSVTPVPGSAPVDADVAITEVAATLEEWADSTRGLDLASNMSFYTDPLEIYYRKRNVPAAQVRAERARVFERYDRMDVTLTDVEIIPEDDGTRATAVFTKTWAFESDERNSLGSVRQQLTLVRSGARWLITGEQDLKVFFTNTDEN